MRTYSELIEIPSFTERFEYLKLDASVGAVTFGFDRYLNQIFYNSSAWKAVRRKVILRDSNEFGVLDLAHPDHPIFGQVVIHHLNPIAIKDIVDKKDYILDPEFLVATCKDTHNAIHYGDVNLLSQNVLVDRQPNDTCPWRN